MQDVFPRIVATPFGIPIRDTVIATWVTMALIIATVWILRKVMPTALEMVFEFLRDEVSNVMGDVPVDPYLPYLGTLAIFLIFANNVSIIPVLETPTKDINTPIALSVTVFFAAHYFGLRRKGFGYLKEQASPMIVLDLVGQVSRTMSMSIRLFGNIIAGETIVAVISTLVKPIAPLPMIALSLITGVLQAYVFLILSTSAISAAVSTRD